MTRWAHLLVFGALVLAAIVYFGAATPLIGNGYDDAHYIALANALARGKGYTQIWRPDAPPEPQYPPGWSLLLSAVWLIAPAFPANVIEFKLVSILSGLVFAALAYGWLCWRGDALSPREPSRKLPLVVVLLTLFNPLILGSATSAFSEMAYGASSILALWMIERYSRLDNATWRDALVPSLIAAWTVYVRTFGVTLIVAAALYLAGMRAYKRGLIFVLFSCLWLAPWFMRGVWMPVSTGGYIEQFMLKSMEQPELGMIGWGDLVARVVLNARAYLFAGLPGAMLPSQVPLTYVNLVEGLRVGAPLLGLDMALGIIVVGGWLGSFIFRRALADWYVACYLALGLLWPWEPTRFVIPLIPLLYAYALFEIALFAGALRSNAVVTRALQLVGVCLLGLFIAANGITQIRYAWTTRQSDVSPEWMARLRLFDWIQRNTREASVLAAMDDCQVYLYTRRLVVRELGTVDALRRYQVEYVVLIPYGGVMVEGDLSRMRFDPLYRSNPEEFDVVYEDAPAGVQVFRVRQENSR